jgi:hypothetical protein
MFTKEKKKNGKRLAPKMQREFEEILKRDAKKRNLVTVITTETYNRSQFSLRMAERLGL